MDQSVETLLSEASDHAHSGRDSAALLNCLAALELPGLDYRALHFCSTVLIDCGLVTANEDAVRRGVAILESLLADVDGADQAEVLRMKYHLSNGYVNIASLIASKDELAAQDHRTKQRRVLEGLLLSGGQFSSDIKPRVIANYANALASAGRVVDAIDHYYDCLRIDNTHAMAMGNVGDLWLTLLRAIPKHSRPVLYEALTLHERANDNLDRLADLVGLENVSTYTSRLKSLVDWLDTSVPRGSEGLRQWYRDHLGAHVDWSPSATLQTWARHRLLLSIAPQSSSCPNQFRDDIFVHTLVTPIGSDLGDRLFDILNHVKEDYATARYLFTLSQRDDDDLRLADDVTDFAESLNYATFGLRAGLLKSSIRTAHDTLDKIAQFLNLYLDLGFSLRSASFSRIWFRGGNQERGINATIVDKMATNHYLAALYDLHESMVASQYPAPARDMRNASTHRIATLHMFLMDDGERWGSNASWRVDDYITRGLLFLRTIRAAILHLVAFVNTEESRRERGKAVTMPFRLHAPDADGFFDLSWEREDY